MIFTSNSMIIICMNFFDIPVIILRWFFFQRSSGMSKLWGNIPESSELVWKQRSWGNRPHRDTPCLAGCKSAPNRTWVKVTSLNVKNIKGALSSIMLQKDIPVNENYGMKEWNRLEFTAVLSFRFPCIRVKKN